MGSLFLLHDLSKAKFNKEQFGFKFPLYEQFSWSFPCSRPWCALITDQEILNVVQQTHIQTLSLLQCSFQILHQAFCSPTWCCMVRRTPNVLYPIILQEFLKFTWTELRSIFGHYLIRKTPSCKISLNTLKKTWNSLILKMILYTINCVGIKFERL